MLHGANDPIRIGLGDAWGPIGPRRAQRVELEGVSLELSDVAAAPGIPEVGVSGRLMQLGGVGNIRPASQ